MRVGNQALYGTKRPGTSGRLLPITRVGDQALYGTKSTKKQWEVTTDYEGR